MTLMPVAEVQAAIVRGVEPLDAETVSIFEAAGRILAQDLSAKLTQPPFAASAMDGYAVRRADIASLPPRLKVIGRFVAGMVSKARFERARRSASSPVRRSRQEPTPSSSRKTPKPRTMGRWRILELAPLGQHIRPRGYDFSEGDTLLASGMELASRQLMLAAAMNNATVAVRRRPIIAILANGDELVLPGQSPASGQIISSIPAGMKAAITAWGGESLLLDLAQDSKESLAARVRDAQEADVLLTIGGASVGEHDLVRGTLEDMGARFEVMKVAMRPGKPVMFGFLDKQRILSMPGNPASAIICARVFLKPLLDRFLGRARRDEPRTVRLAVPLDANGEREHYMRAKLSDDGVAPIRHQDSSLMSVFANADCLLVRPDRGPALPAGALVRVIPLDF